MPVDVISIDKIAMSHFLLKAIANCTLQNYVLASGITFNAGKWTKYVTSAFPIFSFTDYHRLPNNVVPNLQINETLINPIKLIFEICRECIITRAKVTHYDSWVQGEALRQNIIRLTCADHQSGVESRREPSGSGWGLSHEEGVKWM